MSRLRKTAISRHGDLGLTHPKSVSQHDLVVRLLIGPAACIQLGAALFEIAGRNPDIPQPVPRILADGARQRNRGPGDARQHQKRQHRRRRGPDRPHRSRGAFGMRRRGIYHLRNHRADWGAASAETAPPVLSLYHPTVSRSPSSNGVTARNPNSRSARDTSRHRRGCPFGFVVSHTMPPLVPHRLGHRRRRLPDADFDSRPEIHRLRFAVPLRGQQDAFRRVFHIQKFPRRAAVAPQHDLVRARLPRLHELADHRWNHVPVLQIEVVPRPVEIHRQQEDRIQPILLAVRLALDHERLLGDPVRRAVTGSG